MAESLLTPNVVIIGGILAAIIIVVYIIINKKTGLKMFRPKLFSETVYDGMKKKIDLHGTKAKGKLFIGYSKIALIEKYCMMKGKIDSMEFDEKTKTLKLSEDEKPEKYEFMVLKAKSNNLLFRLLGLKKQFFIIDIKNNDRMKFDPKENKIQMPVGTDFQSFGNIWILENVAAEYLIDNFSTKRMLEQINTHLENMPDRIIHLEESLTKSQNLASTYAELERRKYDKTKTQEDTVIS